VVTDLTDGVFRTGLVGVINSQSFYRISVPAGQIRLTIALSGGTGDGDLYVKQGSLPSLGSWDYRPYLGTSNETVVVDNPVSGDWFIMVNGYSAYSGARLLADYINVLPAAATPVITPAAGSYTSAVSVAISTPTLGATIHYTTNGDTPTPSSPVYGGRLP